MSDALANHVLDQGASNSSILAFLDRCQARYAAGERSALFDVIAACARFQAVIPDWAADAILNADQAIDRGEMDTYGDLFGKPKASQRERERETLISRNQRRVRALLIQHRCEDGSWNADEAFSPVAEETGLPRRIIEEIYRRSPGLREIVQGNPSRAAHEQAGITFELPRRRGRKIL